MTAKISIKDSEDPTWEALAEWTIFRVDILERLAKSSDFLVILL